MVSFRPFGDLAAVKFEKRPIDAAPRRGRHGRIQHA